MESPNIPMVGGKRLSPIHSSRKNNVHADTGSGEDKTYFPFSGQTTLPTFRIGGKPCPENDRRLAQMGGTLRPKRFTGK